MIGAHDARLRREALIDHELADWIFAICTNGTDVILVVTSMDAACSINQLRYGSRWLDASDGSSGIDSQLLCPLCVGLNRRLLHVTKQYLQAVLAAKHGIVKDAREGHAKECFLLAVLLPLA